MGASNLSKWRRARSENFLRKMQGAKMNLRQLENLQNRIRAVPDDEWSAAATIVIGQKRQETGIANWLPSLLNGRREFEERTLALVEEKQKEIT